MAHVTEIGRVGSTVYGVAFVVCRNAEVAGLALNMEDYDDALPKMDAAGRAISDAGFNYEWCSDFRAYNGGPRKGLVDAVYYIAEVDEDGELSGWCRTWQAGAGATAIPAEIVTKAEAVVEAAHAAMTK